jgi:hypothetical protein
MMRARETVTPDTGERVAAGKLLKTFNIWQSEVRTGMRGLLGSIYKTLNVERRTLNFSKGSPFLLFFSVR